MKKIDELPENVGRIVIAGHIHPDGDCVGSCLGLKNYLSVIRPRAQVDIYLEKFSEDFGFLQGAGEVCHELPEREPYDVAFVLDCSDTERLGDAVKYFTAAKRRICIDHHITNEGFSDENIICPDASSTCEVLYSLMEDSFVNRAVAECLYTGIVHDTGVFKFSSTSARTMEIAGKLMEKGIDFGEIIDGSFYRKTYVQNQILGRALLESITFMDGKCIFSAIKKKDMDFYGVTSKDLDGIIDQLRLTEGVECALFLYETGPQQYKVSMRSQHVVDVSRIAAYFGGGGHVRAAGCTMNGSIHDVINNLAGHIAKELEEAEA